MFAYRLDLREELPEEFVTDEMRGRLTVEFSGRWLRLDHTELSDGGSYKCQVNYVNAPTQSWRVNLTVYGEPYSIMPDFWNPLSQFLEQWGSD